MKNPNQRSISIGNLFTEEQIDQIEKIMNGSKTMDEALPKMKTYLKSISDHLSARGFHWGYMAYFITSLAFGIIQPEEVDENERARYQASLN